MSSVEIWWPAVGLKHRKMVQMTGLEPVINLGVNETPLPLEPHLLKLVGMPGLEPGASCAQGRRNTIILHSEIKCYCWVTEPKFHSLSIILNKTFLRLNTCAGVNKVLSVYQHNEPADNNKIGGSDQIRTGGSF